MKDRDFLSMMRQLERHGEHRREAGAFLLGPSGPAKMTMGARALTRLSRPLLNRVAGAWGRESTLVTAVAYYKDLDPGSLTGGITFHAIGYTRLSELCRDQDLEVVADIHLHPGNGTRQSSTDAYHPMVAITGHLALIAPRLGEHVKSPVELGAHVMTSNGWNSYFGDDVACVFQLRRSLRGLLMRTTTRLRSLTYMEGHR